jgi:PPOX class probable F420-dependent enzyme
MARKVATNTRVDLDELLDFVRARHRMVLITTRGDGSPQASPVTGGVDDSGRLVISSYPERAKVRNVERRPGVSVVVLSEDWDDSWVQVDGTADVVKAVDDVEPFVEYFRNISGEHPDWAEYRRAMVSQGKALIRITPVAWGPIATGGFPERLAEQDT